MAAAEQKKSYQVVKQFKGLNTKANRTAIDETEFSWVENAQPVGYANLRVIPNSDAVTIGNSTVTFANTVTYLTSMNIGLNDYVIAFQQNGAAQYYRIQDNTFGNVAVAGTFSNSGVEATQWYNDRMLVIDPNKGMFSWDGNNTVAIGAVGVIAVTNPGSGYTTAPNVVISGPDQVGGVQANATAALVSGGSTVGSVSLVVGGTGYTNAANLTVTLSGGGGTGATAIAGIETFATGTVTVNVIDGGAGYTNPANTVVSITGGGGTSAAGTAVISGGTVTQVVMTNPGTGYTNTANLVVSISGGGATTAAKLSGVVNNQTNNAIATFSGRVWVASG